MNSFVNKFYESTASRLRVVKDKNELNAACSNAHKELDEVFDSELFRSGATIACCSGCYYCCHVKVDAQPRDVFLVIDFIRKRFTPEKQTEVLKRAQANWKKIEPMTLNEHLNAGLPCPLLEQGKCSVYPVRPSACRRAHSLRAEPCKKYLEHPESTENFAELVLSVKTATAGAYIGASKAFEKSGYDSQLYDLSAALVEALQNSSCERRWRDGKLAFPKNILAKDWPEEMNFQKLSPD